MSDLAQCVQWLCQAPIWCLLDGLVWVLAHALQLLQLVSFTGSVVGQPPIACIGARPEDPQLALTTGEPQHQSRQGGSTLPNGIEGSSPITTAGDRDGTEGGEAGKPSTAKTLVKSGVTQQQQVKQGTACIKSSEGRLKAIPAPRRLPTAAAAAAAAAGRAPRATAAARAPWPTARKLNIMHLFPSPSSASPFICYHGQKNVTQLARSIT
ncbi:hypothetical protein ABBQ32_009836 [Trebouxia sp. C0010 RCD-2024]